MSYYRFKASISYDGYNYYGFEKQGDLPTIELMLNRAFYNWLGREIKIVASGRTDKYVHALGQVIHFDLDNKLEPLVIKKALNSFLPADIKILNVTLVDLNFHARFMAKKKEYHYLIRKNEIDVFKMRYSAYFYNLDLNKLKEAANYLLGTHNFRTFCSIHTSMLKDFVRIIYKIDIEDSADYIILKFVGNGFLKYQVRRMVGVLVEIAKGRYEPNYILELLAKEDPRSCQYIAPGWGLYLYKVDYED